MEGVISGSSSLFTAHRNGHDGGCFGEIEAALAKARWPDARAGARLARMLTDAAPNAAEIEDDFRIVLPSCAVARGYGASGGVAAAGAAAPPPRPRGG